MHTPFVSVEGAIGVGKTTLATALAHHYNATCLHEIVEENPFLEKFYDNMNEWSFQTEMFFLCNRFKQLEDMETVYLRKAQPVIADYHIIKNLIFAHRTLPRKKFQKYERIYSILTEDLPKPSILIYLRASLPTLLDRIKRRGRAFEQEIDPEYLEQLSHDYDEAMNFLQNEGTTKVIIVETDHLNLAENSEDLQKVFDQMNPYLLRT
ncbi:deoxynucleoside kinase [Shouchella shacheensis]|uniref:deoxynucleoside kinase n=1 Tax=Shouchella shacheensis TaxID=1649580 RepID=UPI00073FEBF1